MAPKNNARGVSTLQKQKLVVAMQPRSQGFHMRTRRDTRKPWSGPVNFAF